MHSYLRAIGFSDVKEGKEIEDLLQDVFRNYDQKCVAKEDLNHSFVEYSKSFGDDMGITICGSLDEGGFHQEYYFPYYNGTGITTREELIIEKHGAKESYLGVCEDLRVGVSLIFYLQNAAKYKKESILNRLLNREMSTTFSGLSLKGKIILPLNKSEDQISYHNEAVKNRKRLLAEAKQGNEEAIESLTLDDIDMYAAVTRRIQTEDVFSVVESFFMPYGMECDQYHIMGEIRSVSEISNSFTKEKIYHINVECNDLIFDVCINKRDLMGEPKVGRRFKGPIWLQGKVNFLEK